jgi:glutathione S-transferase
VLQPLRASATIGGMSVRLLGIPGSHSCAAAAAMLDAKAVTYDRVDLFPAVSRAWLRITGFDGVTVPALRIDGARVQGSRAIARALDATWPDPPLYPSDLTLRARIEQIEAWGDGPLQDVTRRIALWTLLRSRAGVRAALSGSRLLFHVPVGLAVALAWPVVRLDAAINGADGQAVRADLAALPAMLDRIDAWLADGALDAAHPTAADFQLAGSLRLLLCFEDLAPLLSERPSARLARALIPAFPGGVPAGVLPAAWLG